MAADLDRAGQGSGGPAGRAGIPAGPGVHLQVREGDFIVFQLFWD